MRMPLLSPAERRQWAGIAAGSVVLIVAWVISSALVSRNFSAAYLLPASAFAGGVIAGALSPRGWRSGSVSGILSWVFGVSVFALYSLTRLPLASAPGGQFARDFAMAAVMIMALIILPASILGGVLGGILGQLARRRRARGDR